MTAERLEVGMDDLDRTRARALYLEIDHGRAWDAIQDDLGDLEEFAARAAGLL